MVFSAKHFLSRCIHYLPCWLNSRSYRNWVRWRYRSIRCRAHLIRGDLCPVNGDVLVKRVEFDYFDKTIKVSSENPRYPDIKTVSIMMRMWRSKGRLRPGFIAIRIEITPCFSEYSTHLITSFTDKSTLLQLLNTSSYDNALITIYYHYPL